MYYLKREILFNWDTGGKISIQNTTKHAVSCLRCRFIYGTREVRQPRQILSYLQETRAATGVLWARGKALLTVTPTEVPAGIPFQKERPNQELRIALQVDWVTEQISLRLLHAKLLLKRAVESWKHVLDKGRGKGREKSYVWELPKQREGYYNKTC